MRPHNKLQRQIATHEIGFSIIELMVAMGLSMLLLIGVITVFSSSRSTYEVSDRVARLQENGRFALDTIVRDIREAGYQGCTRNLPGDNAPISKLNPAAVPNSGMALISGYTTSPAVFGLEYSGTSTWSPALDTSWITSAANGSDIIVIRRPKPNVQPVKLTASMALPTDNVTVPTTASFIAGDIAMIDDCKTRTYFQVTSFNAATGTIAHIASSSTATSIGNATNALGAKYILNPLGSQSEWGDATIVPMQTVIYFIHTNIDGSKSLWRRVDTNGPEELVEGVEAMQFLYGVDTTGDHEVDQYVKANTIANPASVVAVSVALLIRSIDTYGTIDTDTSNYNLLGETFTAPGDKRLRQTFTATTTIRNFAKADF